MKKSAKSSKSIPKIQATEEEEQDESDGEDEEINKLVQSSINLVLPPAIQLSTEKAFHNLTNKLMKVSSTSQQRKLHLYDNNNIESNIITGRDKINKFL
jgi:hypothetical protein